MRGVRERGCKREGQGRKRRCTRLSVAAVTPLATKGQNSNGAWSGKAIQVERWSLTQQPTCQLG